MPHPLFRLGNRLALVRFHGAGGDKAGGHRDGPRLFTHLARAQGAGFQRHRRGRQALAAAFRRTEYPPLPCGGTDYHPAFGRLRALSPDEAGDIVLAGMGGELIIRLIGEAPWLKAGDKRLILQPMTSAEELRRFLEREGFAILREQAAEEDGHVYSVMLVEYCPAQAGGGELYPYIGKLDGFTPGKPRLHSEMCAPAF